MKISVLLPTRGRITPLIATINSLLDNFSSDNEIEILLRFDEDDNNTFETVKQNIDDRRIKYLVGPRYGYPGLHHYLNELASEAKGDWLMLFNDDALMQTKYWDKEVEKYNDKMVFLDSHSNQNTFSLLFPIVPRKVTEIWGHFSLSRHCDGWMNDIANMLEIKVVLPIHILHDLADLTGNNRDETHKGRKYLDVYRNPEDEALRKYDALVLKRYMEKCIEIEQHTEHGEVYRKTNNTISNNTNTIYAVYRCLYGEDFIQQSINSITNYVDKIFVFWDDIPWGNVSYVIYKGKRIDFPSKFDNILEKINELNNPKIVLIYDHVENNINQFTHLVNDYILPNYKKPDIIMFIEVDYVFRRDQLEKAINEFKSKDYLVASARQVEIWKDFNYRIPERGRLGTIFWNMNKIDKIPPTGRHAVLQVPPFISAYNHNFGFAVSPKVMYWKHLTALAFSQKIGDAMPNEDWYEEKWLKWNYERNNENLEISKGNEHNIPRTDKYDVSQLPETIINDFINRGIFNIEKFAR